MGDVLPAAEWTKRADLAALVSAIGADNIRWVGGAVRDTLLGHPVEDIDAATTLVPEDAITRLKVAGIKSVPTGIEHGTITAVLDGGHVEITTLRKDVSTDGRRATVAFADEWRDDAARRDFTINALYAHPETRVISDFFGGLEDLSARRIRFIGDPRERIREDHLRILRYFRFQARFGADPNQEAVNACRELAGTLTALSRERVTKELLLLLALPDPGDTAELMISLGVWKVIIPETGPRDVERLRDLIGAETSSGTAPHPIRRLAALLPALPAIADEVGVRLRLSRAERARLMCAAERHATDAADPKALAYYHGTQGALDRLLLAGADVSTILDWTPPQLPMKGGEIVTHGVGAGPEVARILKLVEAQWVAEAFPDRNRVEQILDTILAQ